MKAVSRNDFWGLVASGYMLALGTALWRPDEPIFVQFLCFVLVVIGTLMPIITWRWAEDVSTDDT